MEDSVQKNSRNSLLLLLLSFPEEHLASRATRRLLLLPAGLPFPAEPRRRLVGVGEVVPGHQRVRVVLAQYPLAVGEGRLVQRDRLAQPPGRPVSGGEVVPGALSPPSDSPTTSEEPQVTDLILFERGKRRVTPAQSA